MSSAMTITMSSAHYPTFPSLHLRHNSFFNPSVALPMLQLILQPFCCFTYVTVHSPTLLLLLLHRKLILQSLRHFTYTITHSPTLVALPTLQLILQPFHCFTYFTAHSTTLPPLHIRHGHFTYVTWRTGHGKFYKLLVVKQELGSYIEPGDLHRPYANTST